MSATHPRTEIAFWDLRPAGEMENLEREQNARATKIVDDPWTSSLAPLKGDPFSARL